MSGVNISQLSKAFMLHNVQVPVFSKFELSIPAGKVTVILGKSGCGKTTLLRMISGLEPYEQGTIAFSVDHPRIGVIYQEPRLLPWLNVEQNIGFCDRMLRPELVQRYMEMMGLSRFALAYPRQLSGGMAQRVAIARALYYEPDLILMDEPFASLDYFTRNHLQQELGAIHRQTGKTFVLVTHNVDEALALGHQIVVLQKGRCVRTDNLDDSFIRDAEAASYQQIKKGILEQLSLHEKKENIEQ